MFKWRRPARRISDGTILRVPARWVNYASLIHPRGALRANKKFLNHFQADLPGPVLCAKKESASREAQISPRTSAPSRPARGAYRDRHGRWVGLRWTRKRRARDAGRSRAGFPVSDASVPDERRSCVRRRRVVLAPVAGVKLAEICRAQPGVGGSSIRQRWRQEEFVSRRARYKPSNHCAGKAGCPG